MPSFTIRAAGRVFRCEIDTGESGPERALFAVGCDRSTVVKSEMSDKGPSVNHGRENPLMVLIVLSDVLNGF